MALPTIPAAAVPLPVRPPMFTPVGWPVGMPSAKIPGGIHVVGDRNAQDEQGHGPRFNEKPGAIIPVAHIPVVVLVSPIEAIVEEVVAMEARGVIDRVAGDQDQLRVSRDVDANTQVRKTDADPHPHLGRRRHRHAQNKTTEKQCGAKSCHIDLQCESSPA